MRESTVHQEVKLTSKHERFKTLKNHSWANFTSELALSLWSQLKHFISGRLTYDELCLYRFNPPLVYGNYSVKKKTLKCFYNRLIVVNTH